MNARNVFEIYAAALRQRDHRVSTKLGSVVITNVTFREKEHCFEGPTAVVDNKDTVQFSLLIEDSLGTVNASGYCTVVAKTGIYPTPYTAYDHNGRRVVALHASDESGMWIFWDESRRQTTSLHISSLRRCQ